MRKLFLAILFIGFSAFITGCGGSNSNSPSVADSPSPTPTPSTVTYTIGGTVSGLNGSLTIKNNSTDQLVVTSSGQFTFNTPIDQGGQYNVTITTQPSTQTCSLSDYSGTNVSANITTISIACSDNPPNTTSLSLSASSLALAASGTSRIFMVTNTGQVSALSVNINASPSLPTGTTTSSTCTSTLAPGSSCVVTISPGPTASASASAGSAAIPSTLTINGSNTNSVDANIYILTYGSIYQSGYVYSIDDATPATNNIGGKVWALSDQSSALEWSTANDPIPGITETSTSPCHGSYDGSCNTSQIVTYYSTPYSNYAAGLCKSTINGYGDWYLPSVCELSTAGASICPLGYQNIQGNLVSSNIVTLSNNYWSSTESSLNPRFDAYLANLNSSGGGSVNFSAKVNQLNVRCTRALTD